MSSISKEMYEYIVDYCKIHSVRPGLADVPNGFYYFYTEANKEIKEVEGVIKSEVDDWRKDKNAHI